MPFLVLFMEETFATAEIVDTSAPRSPSTVQRKSWYLPKENLKNGLASFCAGANVEKIFLVDRFTKKILKFRLGGSVAFFTKPGLAKYHELTMQGTFGDSRFFPDLKPALSSEDLRFEILDFSKSLVEIEPKLKLMGCKRILIHHPDFNSASEVKKGFEDLGYEVLSIPYPSRIDEIREALLNLSVQGTLEDIQSEISTAVGASTPLLWFGRKGFQSNNAENRYSFLHQWPPSQVDRIFVGWDQIYLLQTNGSSVPLFTGLGSVFEFESLKYNWAQNQNLDPGPLCFGRGQKMMAIDFFVEEFCQQGFLSELVHREKFDSKFNSLWKVCQKLHPKLELQEVKSAWLEQVLIEALAASDSNQLEIIGPASHLLKSTLAKIKTPASTRVKMNADFELASWVLK